MTKFQRFRSLYMVAALLGGLILMCDLAIPSVGLLSAAATYTGTCSGFTDGSAPCSWSRYALHESFWAMMLLTIPNLLLGFVFGAVFSAALFRSAWQHLVPTPHKWLPLLLGGGVVLLGGLIGAVIVVALPANLINFLGASGQR